MTEIIRQRDLAYSLKSGVGLLSDCSRLLFTFAEADDGLKVNAVGMFDDNLESSFIVLGRLPVFLESDNDLSLFISVGPSYRHTLALSAPGNLTGVYKLWLWLFSVDLDDIDSRSLHGIKSSRLERLFDVTCGLGDQLIEDLLKKRFGFPVGVSFGS